MSKIDIWGFINLDLDGVLRSWAVNGTILEALPLDSDQITAFIDMREGIVEAQRTSNERIVFKDISGFDVPTAQLLNPPEDVRPGEEIEKAQSSKLALAGVLPVPSRSPLAARSYPPAYCNGPNYECAIYVGCEACYGGICWGIMGARA